MVVYKVTQSDFRTLTENKEFKKGKEYEITNERAESINKQLKDKHGIENNLVRVDELEKPKAEKKENPKKEKKEDVKEKADK